MISQSINMKKTNKGKASLILAFTSCLFLSVSTSTYDSLKIFIPIGSLFLLKEKFKLNKNERIAWK